MSRKVAEQGLADIDHSRQLRNLSTEHRRYFNGTMNLELRLIRTLVAIPDLTPIDSH